MTLKYIKMLSIAAIMLGNVVAVSAQTLRDVSDAYNKADELLTENNISGAITEFEKCLELAIKVGSEADELRVKAENALPDLFLQKTNKLLENKNYDEASTAFGQMISASEKYNSPDVKEKAEPAKKALCKHYYNQGLEAMKQKKFDDALKSFTRIPEIDDASGDAYYQIASCHNYKKSWDNAIANAQKALKLKTDADAKDLDKVYYELGTAYAGKKDNGRACEFFKKVTSPPFLAGAKYQIETALKCK